MCDSAVKVVLPELNPGRGDPELLRFKKRSRSFRHDYTIVFHLGFVKGPWHPHLQPILCMPDNGKPKRAVREQGPLEA